MAFGNAVYSALFRRTSTFTLTLILGSVFFERWYDSWADLTWERMNRGVRAVGVLTVFTIQCRVNVGYCVLCPQNTLLL